MMFDPLYMGSENKPFLPDFAEKRALEEKPTCKLQAENLLFKTSYGIVLPSRSLRYRLGIPQTNFM